MHYFKWSQLVILTNKKYRVRHNRAKDLNLKANLRSTEAAVDLSLRIDQVELLWLKIKSNPVTIVLKLPKVSLFPMLLILT